MSTGKAVAELLAGLLGACCGVLLMYRTLHPRPEYPGAPEPLGRIMLRVAGIGLVLAGIGMMIQSIRELLK